MLSFLTTATVDGQRFFYPIIFNDFFFVVLNHEKKFIIFRNGPMVLPYSTEVQ